MAGYFRSCVLWGLVIISAALSGCASAARGANIDFTVSAPQKDVSILFDLETVESRKAYDWRVRRDALQADRETPDFEYHECEALPCTLNIPKARTFSVVAHKDGYKPKIYHIAHVHKDNLETVSNAAAVGAVSATVGSTYVIAANVSPLFTLSGPATSLAAVTTAASVLLVALPASVFLLGSNEVDKDSKANYLFFPNPLEITLDPLGPDDPPVTKAQIKSQFDSQRIAASLDPVKSDMCYIGDERMGCWRYQKLKKRREKAAR